MCVIIEFAMTYTVMTLEQKDMEAPCGGGAFTIKIKRVQGDKAICICEFWGLYCDNMHA